MDHVQHIFSFLKVVTNSNKSQDDAKQLGSQLTIKNTKELEMDSILM